MHHLDDGRVDELRGVVHDFAGEPRRQLFADRREHLAHALGHVEDVGVGRHLDADEHRTHAAERHVEVVVLGPQGDVGDVLQAHDGAAALAHGQRLEFLHRVQVGAGRERHRHHLPLGGAEAGQVVIRRQRGADLGGGDTVGSHLVGVEPGAQGELARAQQFGRLHAVDRIELGFYHAGQVVGDVIGGQRVAVKAHVHGVGGLPHLHAHHRLLRLRRQLVAYRVHLRGDLGQRAVGIVVQLQRGGNRRYAAVGRRRQVVDPLRLGDGRFQRLGDEAGDGGGVGPVVRGGDGDHRVLRLRILVDRKAEQRTQAQHHDQQADHGGQHRPFDEDVGKVHGAGILTVPAAWGSGCWPAARDC